MNQNLLQHDSSSYQHKYNAIRPRTHRLSTSIRNAYSTVIEEGKFDICSKFADFWHGLALAYSIIIRSIIYIGFSVTSSLMTKYFDAYPWILPIIIWCIPTFIIIIFIIHTIKTHLFRICYILSYLLGTLIPYTIWSFITCLQQRPYLEYKGMKLFSILYKFVHKKNLSALEKNSREVVLRYYLMVNYLASYKSIFQGLINANDRFAKYKLTHNKMMDYKQECFDNYYELNQLNKNYTSKLPQHINMWHNAILDIREFDDGPWDEIHYRMNTFFGVMFYVWKFILFILENFMGFQLFYDNMNNGWFVWIGFLLLKDIVDLIVFNHFVRFNVIFKTYYFDNKVLAAILRWKKGDVIFDELSRYYWDYMTRIACKQILVEYLNEIHIAIIIQSYMGEPELSLSKGDANKLRNYYIKVSW